MYMCDPTSCYLAFISSSSDVNKARYTISPVACRWVHLGWGSDARTACKHRKSKVSRIERQKQRFKKQIPHPPHFKFLKTSPIQSANFDAEENRGAFLAAWGVFSDDAANNCASRTGGGVGRSGGALFHSTGDHQMHLAALSDTGTTSKAQQQQQQQQPQMSQYHHQQQLRCDNSMTTTETTTTKTTTSSSNMAAMTGSETRTAVNGRAETEEVGRGKAKVNSWEEEEEEDYDTCRVGGGRAAMGRGKR